MCTSSIYLDVVLIYRKKNNTYNINFVYKILHEIYFDSAYVSIAFFWDSHVSIVFILFSINLVKPAKFNLELIFI